MRNISLENILLAEDKNETERSAHGHGDGLRHQ